MKRIGFILVFCTFFASGGFAASRTTTVASTSIRNGTPTQRVRTTDTPKSTSRVAVSKNKTTKRNTAQTGRATTNRNVSARGGAVVARAASATETQIGAEYENCKAAYFSCMDQFCQLKSDEYRRCSCSDRISTLQSAKNNLTQAGEQLNEFNENLEIVGKTAAQAAAMNTASDGELALTRDKSASQALLTAIMNSIRGNDARVENTRLSDLNSIDLSFDTANSFGTTDIGQTIASYNGGALYTAVYPQCRNAVKTNCNNASLQRAVNAYLMAIEQDCNTVQTAIIKKQRETHAAIRESSSLLDLARAENHQNHNSDDIATCIANIETAILSEDACGANYHKCLDNGEYIDVSTGAPIAGVVDFYKLGTMLTFTNGRTNDEQRLAQNPNNRNFVNAFEKRVKKFAEPALDKCYDDADTVWTNYLNKALLDIYYAQQSKVAEIKQGCFDFVSACYMNGSTAMTTAMQGLVAAQTTTLTPNVLTLNKSLCSDYINSCNNMFDGQIVAQYINNRHETDSLTACRAVVQQCFDNYGGTNYENFYYPSSGLFDTGHAPDWFALYECSDPDCTNPVLKSECAKQLASIDACSDTEMIEAAFGGFNYYPNETNIYNKYATNNPQTGQRQNRLLRTSGVATEIYNQIIDILQTGCSNLDGQFMNVQNLALYSNNYNPSAFCEATFHKSTSRYNPIYQPYSVGKRGYLYTINQGDISYIPTIQSTQISSLPSSVAIGTGNTKYFYENMCPRDYNETVDVQSWGACLCWENGGRRSNDGTTTRCTASFPVRPMTTYNVSCDGNSCSAQQIATHGLNHRCYMTPENYFTIGINQDSSNTSSTPLNAPTATSTFSIWEYDIGNSSFIPTEQDWCTAEINNKNQVCPFGVGTTNGECNDCPFDWVIVNPSESPENQKCCPQDYTLNTTTNKCQNSDASLTTPPAPISSAAMTTSFPAG